MDKATDIRFDTAVSCLGKKLKLICDTVPFEIKSSCTEIRLRINKPVEIITMSGRVYITDSGISESAENCDDTLIRKTDLLNTFHSICGYSVHSHTEEIKNGFITIKGGHRAGICGTAVFTDGKISSVKDISSLNIRIAREIMNCAGKLYYILKKERCSMLIAGKPLSGKTTVLRDLARLLSTESKVSVIDERGELAGTYLTVAQNDLGMCDVFNGYGKSDGIVHAIRAMSPEYIVCDEIGGKKDAEFIADAANAGVNMIASIHAQSMEELLRRKNTSRLFESLSFKYIVFVDKTKDFVIYREKEQRQNEAFGYDSDNIYRCGNGIYYERQT